MNKERLKHTPIPWQVSWGHDITGYPVFAIHGLSGPEKRDRQVLDANARLIAAAPELLEALDDLLNLDDRCGWFSKEADRALAVLRKITEV